SGLWTAPILYPSTLTLAFSEHLLGIAVPVAPIVWLTNPIFGHNVAFILTYVLAAVSMFVLARFITGRDAPAILAALAFAFAPARADQLAHIQVLASGWMPLCLWALHRYFATFSLRALVVFALAFAWQAYSNGYFLYFLSLPVAIVAVFEIATRRHALKGRLGRTLLELSSAAAAMLLALAPIVYAYLEVRRIYGFRRGYRELVSFSASVESYFHVAEPVRLWGEWLAHDLSPERQLFPGFTALLLAGAGIVSGRRYVWCYLTIAAVALFMSLGPEPSAWGSRILPFSPYLALARVLPGFDGLRVPARWSAVVLLGISVLAAVGAARLVDAAERRARAAGLAAVFVLGIAIVLEGWAAPIPLAAFDARGREIDRPLYEWLAEAPPGAVLELPIKAFDIAPTLTYQYATLVHRHPLVNGFSGYGSALQSWLGGPTTPLNELVRMDVAADALQALGIQYVIVHRDDYTDRSFADQTIERLRALGPQIAAERRFGRTVAFQLSAVRKFAEPAASIEMAYRISPGTFSATASHGAARLGEAFDGNVDSHWITGRGQRGDEWLRIDLAEPRRIAAVRLTTTYGSLGEYPRGLTIEAIDDRGSVTTLRTGPVLASLAKGLLENALHPRIEVPLPDAPPARALVLRQTDRTGNLNWSIAELELFGSR
ncbi:MAG: discoidin domain-containing protein, partial [Vicinamibacterales bacterium]